MTINKNTVFVIDDDPSVRRSLTLFLSAAGYRVESFGSMEEYLSREPLKVRGCLILDLYLEGRSSFELQDELINQESHLPIIFITGQGDIHKSVHALKKGAINFLEKPFDDKELLDSVDEALALSQRILDERAKVQHELKMLESLTNREMEVLEYLLRGLLNKQIAAELNIAEQTVKIHRQNISTKLKTKSIVDIVRIAEKAGIQPSTKKLKFGFKSSPGPIH